VIQIPWEQKIKYKFIVDGEWRLHEDQPTEVDPGGFVNNIYTAPAKPVLLPALETGSLPVEAGKANNHSTNGVSVVSEVVDKPEYAPQTLPKHAQSLAGTDGKIIGAELNTPDPSGLLSDIAARDGVPSALAYVAPALGAAIHSLVSVDPINVPKVSLSISLA
jgi:Glycogen recognition site of AMP-activated protein kinase